MSTDHARLSRFLSGDCPECGTPGYHRHLSAVGGCGTCMADDPRPVHIFPCSPRGVLAPGGKCYRMASGAIVHIKPGCRC